MLRLSKLALFVIIFLPLYSDITRKSAYPIDQLFLNRWSARAMSGEAITDSELMPLFEAARWAPSGGNRQPWRFIYAKRDTHYWLTFLDLLSPGNRIWAQNASALVLIVSQHTHELSGKPIYSHALDAGAAWENLALQGTLNNLVVHGIGGFDRDAAVPLINLPSNFTIELMVAIGKPGDPETLPDYLRAREHPSDRKPLNEIVFEGQFS